jgi:hypothetical protein
MVYLERLHREEIVEDVSDRLWSLLGQAVHVILARASADNALHEEPLLMKVNGWTISGRPDRWESPGILRDYKCTSVWSFLRGEKPEWEAQINFYAVLYRQVGLPVYQGFIDAILRDWYRAQARRGGDYPVIPFISQEIPIWEPHIAVDRMRERVILHQRARSEGIYPACTVQERWAKPDIWAVKKVGRKRAIRLLESQTDAEDFAARPTVAMDDVEIEHRSGANTRCDDYCSVSPWCQQYQTMKGETNGGDSA